MYSKMNTDTTAFRSPRERFHIIASLICGAMTLLAFAGCNTPTAPQEPALAPLMEAPEPPQTRSAELNLTLTAGSPEEISFAQSRQHIIDSGAKVVINVPQRYEAFRANAFQGSDADPEHPGRFATLGYFHVAEQHLEMELMRHGFRVLSREKFEAKLREIRDKRALRPFEVWAIVDDDYNQALNNLRDALEEGSIDERQFASRALELRREFGIDETGGAGRADGSYEMSDMSELIRAAQSGSEDERADYILEIGEFVIDPSAPLRTNINLLGHPDMRDFRDAHPWASDAIAQGWVRMPYEELVAKLKARLVNVRSGEIVWSGSAVVPEGELGETPDSLAVRYRARETVANRDAVERFIDEQNTRSNRILRARNGNPSTPAYELRVEIDGPEVVSGSQRVSQRSTDERERVQRALAAHAAERVIGIIDTAGNN